ncbi:MAG: GGDEF domain-containing protein [Jatrophihabitans sp.]|uniref:GGDEF domain-containing protein n=1 Tax=Jatrophihabitans sp. TaxID=1932789 RepID=UPI003F7EE00F
MSIGRVPSSRASARAHRTGAAPATATGSLVDRFRPRSESVAAWVLFALTSVAVVATVVFTAVVPQRSSAGSVITFVLCGMIAVLSCCLVALRRPPGLLWAAYPFLAVVLLVVVDVITGDASTTAQVFFFFPVLYAGAQLRRSAVVPVLAAAAIGDAVVTLTASTTARAWADLAFVVIVLTTSAAILVVAGERNDRLIAQLERQAAVDPLTGLTTRRVLDAAMQSALEGAGDESGTALILLDVDHFKSINDEHGHPAGDAVLRQLAGVLLAHSRRDDLVSRLGGDEIALLLPACPLPTAEQRAVEVLEAVRRHRFDVGAHSMAAVRGAAAVLEVTLSIGVAHVATGAGDLRSLYAAADAALYDAKRGGRDQVVTAPTAAATDLPAPDRRSPSTGRSRSGPPGAPAHCRQAVPVAPGAEA